MRVRLNGIKLSYYEESALEIDALEFEGSLGVLGYSGSGKTNFLKVIAGLEYIDSGEIFFDDNEIASIPIRNRGLSLISKHTALFENKTVYQNLAYPLKKHGINKHRINEIVQATGSTLLDAKVKCLSENEKTDLLLLRALIREPKLILIDEPCRFVNNPAHFNSRLKEIYKGKQVVYATYNIEDLEGICTQFIVLNGGRIVFFGNKEDAANCTDPYVKGIVF